MKSTCVQNTHLEIFRKLQKEPVIDPQLLKRTSEVPFGMQLVYVRLYVVILIKKTQKGNIWIHLNVKPLCLSWLYVGSNPLQPKDYELAKTREKKNHS